MTTTSDPVSTRRELGPGPLIEWITKRGVLCLFLLMPAAAVLVGYLWRLTSLPVAMFGVFVSFAAFTAWVSYHTTVSDDPDEPVHHLHRYALYAVLPVVAFSLTHVAALFLADIAYLQLWSDVGSHLTGEPSAQPWARAGGALLYAVVGMGIVMSYYVLFNRRSLLTATLSLGVALPVLVLYVFTAFAVAGTGPGPTWYLVHWLAFGVVAVATWAMPMFWTRVWARRRPAAR